MVPPIPIEHREEIVKLREAGYSFRNIRDALMQKGVKYSVIGIGNCYQKIMKNGSIDAQPKQKYSKEMLERIKQELQTILEENSDLTGQQQIDEIKRRLGVTVSMDAVGRYRRMLGWKVMPVASNKSSNKSIDTSASNASQSGLGDISLASTDGANGDSNGGEHHPQQSAAAGGVRTSGYYLHPPDVLLPPELSTVAASLPTLGNGGGGAAGGESATSAAFRLANDAVQRQESVVGNGAGGLELVNNGAGVDVKVVKAEYGVASTSNVQPQMQLIHTSQGQILAEMSQDGTTSTSQLAGMPLNTAIVYPLKQAKFGPMHVFTSRAIIRIGHLKYQVWAGISLQGATSICIWDANCRMRSQFYCTTILEKFYIPFCNERYANKRCILVQGNDPIYRSIETKTYMDQHGIIAETWVPGQYGSESNPIELIWDEIGDHIKNEVKPRTLDDLREAICNFWATKMTDQKCRLCLKKCSIFSEY